MDINAFFNDVMHMFIFTIATFFPLKQDKICDFINTHFGKLMEHMIIIAFCHCFSDSTPNCINDNSYCIVIVLTSIGLSILLLTPLLRHLYKYFLVPISMKLASEFIYNTHLCYKTDNLMLNL